MCRDVLVEAHRVLRGRIILQPGCPVEVEISTNPPDIDGILRFQYYTVEGKLCRCLVRDLRCFVNRSHQDSRIMTHSGVPSVMPESSLPRFHLNDALASSPNGSHSAKRSISIAVPKKMPSLSFHRDCWMCALKTTTPWC